MVGVAMAIITCGTLAALFSTARRRNGYAGLHDLASGTRVVMHRRRVEARASQNTSSAGRAHAAGPSRIGPYLVDESTAATAHVPVATPTLVEGYDDRLRRPVWIQLLPTGTPPLPPLRRDLARPARPRWLAGRRTDGECWDAFEVADGRPLADIAVTPQPWSRVRHWMADLTHEVGAGVADGSLPDLELDRVWIGADDRARLLDWPAGTPPVAQRSGATSPPDLSACCRFLYHVAIRALGAVPARGAADGIGLPLPVPGRDLLVKLRDCRYESADAVTADVDRALRTPAAVSRTTRAMQLAGCAALPILAPAIAFSAMTAIARLDTADPKLMDLLFCLERVSDKDTPPEQRGALEIYVATHLRATVEDPSTWTRPFPALGRSPGLPARARRILDEHADVAPQALAKAEPIATAFLDGERKRLADIRAPQALGTAVRLSAIVALCATAILALIMAVLLRGGFTFRTFGTAVTTASGADVSRIRAGARALVAWSPALLLVVLPRVWHGLATNTGGGVALPVGTVLVMIAGGAFAILRPERGIPDQVTGTWLVPK
jgi:hypothetical protein